MVKKNTRKPRRRVVSRRRSTFKQKVNRIISSQVEKKLYVVYAANNAITTAAATNPFSVNLMPTLTQGVTQESRIGQQIKIKSAIIKGFVNILPYNAVSNPLSTPVMIKLWVISSKLVNTSTIASTNIATSFFEVGSDTVGFQGNLLDMTFPVNADMFTVHRTKRFEIGSTYASSTGPVGTGGYYDNSKMILPFSFNYGKYFKTQLKYNDDSSFLNGNLPTNRNCWLVAQAVYCDGSSSAITCAEFHYTLKIEYTDM